MSKMQRSLISQYVIGKHAPQINTGKHRMLFDKGYDDNKQARPSCTTVSTCFKTSNFVEFKVGFSF